MLWYIVAFLAGVLFWWHLGYRLMNRVYGKGKQLTRVLTSLNPDAFKRLRDAVDAEAKRRAELVS